MTALLPFMEDTLRRSAAPGGLLARPASGARRGESPAARAARPGGRTSASLAARALTRSTSTSAELAPGPSVAELLVRAADDPSPQVRINALRSLAELPGLDARPKHRAAARRSAPRACRCRRPKPWASSAAPRRPAPGAGRGRQGHLRAAPRRPRGARPGRFRGLRAGGRRSWRTSTDWLDRAAAARGHGDRRARARRRRSSPIATAGSSPPGSRPGRTRSRARMRRSWRPRGRSSRHADAAVRSVAADAVARAGRPGRPAGARADVPGDRPATPFPRPPSRRSTRSWRSGRAGPRPRAGWIAEFLQGRRPGPRDYLLRRWAEDKWPEAAARWGPAYPIATGRSLQDYRDVAAPLSHWRPTRSRGPHVVIETEQRGPVEVRAARARGAAHGGQLPPAGGPPVLRRQPLAPGGAQLRRPGRRSARRRLRRPRRRHPGRDQPQPLRRADARHGALRARHRHAASGSSTSARSPTSTGPTPCSARWWAASAIADPDHARAM